MLYRNGQKPVVAAGRWLGRGSALSVAGLVLAGLAAHPASAETRSYVVQWMTGASYNQDGDCAGGINLDIDLQYQQDLLLVGMSKEEVAKLFDTSEEQTAADKGGGGNQRG